jgi:disulfide bond formation protein DsbB
MAIALGAGLIALLNYRILLLAIAGLMTLAAGYLLTRHEQHRATITEIPEPPAPECSLPAEPGPRFA